MIKVKPVLAIVPVADGADDNKANARRAVAEQWYQSNADLYYVLEFACSGRAETCVRRLEVGVIGRPNVGAAWKA